MTHDWNETVQADARVAGTVVCGLRRRRKTHEAKYRIAANKTRDLIPVQSESDSNMPPTIAPSRLEPRASGENWDSEKLLMKMIPTKKTGRQRTNVAAKVLARTEVKKIDRL